MTNDELRALLELEEKLPPAPWVKQSEDGSMLGIGTMIQEGVCKGQLDELNHAYTVTRCRSCTDRSVWEKNPCYAGTFEIHETIVKLRNAFREMATDLLGARELLTELECYLNNSSVSRIEDLHRQLKEYNAKRRTK